MLEKADGREVLRRVFQEAGYEPVADYVLGTHKLDGYDPVRRVGYEYVTLSAPERIEELDRLNAQGQVRLFLVDEYLIREAHDLASAARDFLSADG